MCYQSTSSFKTSSERRVFAAEEAVRSLERDLSQAQAYISRLESDRRWLADREQKEKEEREQRETEWEAERVSIVIFVAYAACLTQPHETLLR